MLDETTCNHEDLPCARPNGKDCEVEGPIVSYPSEETQVYPKFRVFPKMDTDEVQYSEVCKVLMSGGDRREARVDYTDTI